MDDDGIRLIVGQLARPHRSGGNVIERAAVMAAGEESGDILNWIVSHGGEPETQATARPAGGLHGGPRNLAATSLQRPPARYILPPGALQAGPQ